MASTGSAASKKTNYLWDPNAPLPLLAREMTGSNALLREYQYGRDLVSMRTGGAAYYYHLDGLGGVVNVTSASGATQWTYDYFPFGATRTATRNASKAPVNVLAFTGQLLDPTGLYHLRARQYDPGTGRFTATDPAAAGPTDPYVSAYAYVNGNPVRYTDPSGQCVQFLLASAVGGATVIAGVVVSAWCVLAGLVGLAAIGTTTYVATQGVPEHPTWDLFKGTSRRELEREIKEAGWTLKPGSGRGPHDVYEKPHQRDIQLPRHKDISPGVTRQIRDILRNGGSAFMVLPSSLGANGK